MLKQLLFEYKYMDFGLINKYHLEILHIAIVVIIFKFTDIDNFNIRVYLADHPAQIVLIQLNYGKIVADFPAIF